MTGWHEIPEIFSRNIVAVAGTVGWLVTDSRFIGGITALWVLVQMSKFVLTWWREERKRWADK